MFLGLFCFKFSVCYNDVIFLDKIEILFFVELKLKEILFLWVEMLFSSVVMFLVLRMYVWFMRVEKFMVSISIRLFNFVGLNMRCFNCIR